MSARILQVRVLGAADVSQYRKLMLEAYATATDSFTSTAEERAQERERWWLERLDDCTGRIAAFGVDEGDQLMGTVTIEYSRKQKVQHAAQLLGMYVHETARGKGVGMALLLAALDHARQHQGVRIVNLTVTEGNEPAIGMYRRAGFQPWGTQPMAIATSSGYQSKIHMSCLIEDDIAASR